MKNILVVFILFSTLLSGCSFAGDLAGVSLVTQRPVTNPLSGEAKTGDVNVIGENAVLLEEYDSEITKDYYTYQCGNMINHEMKGYFIVKINYAEGTANGIELVTSSPDETSLLKITDADKSDIYASELIEVTAGTTLELFFAKPQKYQANIKIYFVSDAWDSHFSAAVNTEDELFVKAEEEVKTQETYLFHVGFPGHYHLDLNTDKGRLNLTIEGPGGEVVSVEGKEEHHEELLLEAGDYRITVDTAEYVGTFRFKRSRGISGDEWKLVK